MAASDRNKLIYYATVCLEHGLYNKTIGYMKQVAQTGVDLNMDERNLIFEAYVGKQTPLVNILNILSDPYHSDDTGKKLIAETKKDLCVNCNKLNKLTKKLLLQENTSKESEADYKYWIGIQHSIKALLKTKIETIKWETSEALNFASRRSEYCN